MTSRPKVLCVSKPVAPPWNDSSKNLVRDLALGLQHYQPVVMSRAGAASELSGVEMTQVYPATAGGFAPGLVDNARVMRRLVFGARAELWHFFFAPNPKSSAAGRLARNLRRVKTVHTVCSAPAEDANLSSVLFADRTVVLSKHTEARFVRAGVDEARICRIPPAIAPLEVASAAARRSAREHFALPQDALIYGYPGDLEFGGGAEVTLRAFAALPSSDAHLVMACRIKTDAARQAEAKFREEATALGIADRLHWVGETPHIHTLLAAFDLTLLPSANLYAKMDYPLVLLEAMSLGCPVVVGAGTPAVELAEGDAAIVAECDVDAVRAVMQAGANDAMRKSVGARGRERVLADFTRASMASAYEALYGELLESSAR